MKGSSRASPADPPSPGRMPTTRPRTTPAVSMSRCGPLKTVAADKNSWSNTGKHFRQNVVARGKASLMPAFPDDVIPSV